MSKKIVVCAVFTVMSSLMVAGPASAVHCGDAADPTTPGFSYFGTDHVKESAHDREGGNPGPHAGTSGASNCQEDLVFGDPSDRAPGQNK